MLDKQNGLVSFRGLPDENEKNNVNEEMVVTLTEL